MRYAPAIVLLGLCCGAALVVNLCTAADRNFPYRTHTARHQTVVRSAPSDGAYATDALAANYEVEVFNVEPNGWCAIRPPAGSFSWAPARYLKSTSDSKLAEVLDDGVVAWVGSRVTGISRPHGQVRLKKGEVVEVLGSARLVSSEGGVLETWCKIAPPAGEFRYVHQNDLAPAVGGQVRPVAYTESASATSGATTASTDRPATDDSGNTLAELEEELEQFDRQPPAEWRITAMIEQAGEFVERGATSVERGKARMLLERLEQWAARLPSSQSTGSSAPSPAIPTPLARQATGREAAGLPPRQPPARIAQPAAESSVLRVSNESPGAGLASQVGHAEPVIRERAAAPTGPAADPRYDGKGWLMPVLSRRSELPPFALTDDQGQILQYVSPAPGLNLHRYVKQEVGVYGHRGQNPRLGAAHLTVQRVVVLDRHR